jgi:hypothetical protein
MMGWLKDNELERMWKEAVVAFLKVLSRHLPGGTEENDENLSQNCRSPGRDLSPGPPEYEAGVLTTRFVTRMQDKNQTKRWKE